VRLEIAERDVQPRPSARDRTFNTESCPERWGKGETNELRCLAARKRCNPRASTRGFGRTGR
jgi:hypothetical protein